MRTIKFRAWDKLENRFVFDLAFPITEISEKADLGRYDIQQFTGLLDKNGKEIYEGDILQYEHRRYVTEFKDGGYLFLTNDINVNKSPTYVSASVIKGYSSIEIIGDIYSNPELLK